MKLLRIIRSVDPKFGGPVEALLRSAEEMNKHGHTTEVVSLDFPNMPFLASIPFRVHALGVRGFFSQYHYSSYLVPWLRANIQNYDIAVVEGLWNYTSIGTWRALAGGAVPYVVFVHGMLDPWFKHTYPWKHFLKTLYWMVGEGRVLRDAAAVLFTAEDERKLARNMFPLYRYREEVVAFGTADVTGHTEAQIAQWRRFMPALGTRRYLLFLSRIHPKKGCDVLIRAFSRIAEFHSDLDLVIAGPDQVAWQAELLALAQRCGVADRVHWPGMISGELKWGAFKGAEAFVLPSHQENFGLVVAESLACGTPVLISTKVNIWQEIVEAGAGMVAADTEDGTFQMLEDFLALEATSRNGMSKAARSCFLKNFEISRAALHLSKLLAKASTHEQSAKRQN